MKRPPHRPPSLQELKDSHGVFAQKEARDLFYRVATDLVDRAIKRETQFTLGESIAVLLATWNRRFYQRKRRCDQAHVEQIDSSLRQRGLALLARRLDSLANTEERAVTEQFTHFEQFLGPVGTGKAFHLIAPRFFPLWDNEIAKEFGVALQKMGTNAHRYWLFINKVNAEIIALGGATVIEMAIATSALKAHDENSYCRYTNHWL